MHHENTQRTQQLALTSLRYLEIAAWTAGTLLLATYAGSRSWYAHARDQAVAAFADAHVDTGPSPPTDATIDMSTWSPRRIEHYRSTPRSEVPLAVLQIPAVKLVVPVFEGTSDENLNRGAARIEGTARFGASGNVGIAAHRDGFFRALKDVQVGDTLRLERRGAIDTYQIVATTIVDPSDVSVLAPSATNSVTLVTCFPFYFVGSAPLRFIVRAERTTEKRRLPASKPTGVEGRVASGEVRGIGDHGVTASAIHQSPAAEFR